MTTKGSPHKFGTIPPGDPSKVRGVDNAIDAAFAQFAKVCGGDINVWTVIFNRLSRVLASMASENGDWRDIDTAPVDNTQVLVWHDAYDLNPKGYTLETFDSVGDRSNNRTLWAATKWQPLPAPPKGHEP